MLKQATIVGDGAMGTVCALLLAENGTRVRLWGRNHDRTQAINEVHENRRYLPGTRLPDEVSAGSDRQWAFADAELIISAVPSQFIRATWQQMIEYIPAGVPIISVAKGIENNSLLRPTEVLAEICGPRSYGILSGPSIANEIAAGLPCSVVIACTKNEVALLAQEAFTTDWFRVYTNDDLVGVELASALKNVIAIAAGAIDGLKLGDNAKAGLLSRGLAEITRLGVAMGAKAETFYGLAGVGDLVTTCISPHGRNRTAGQRIGEGRSAREVIEATASVIEGIATTRSVLALAHKYGVEMPITEAVGAVLFDNIAPEEAVRTLMRRQVRAE